jgi:pimeloyl-ACP methyl ester carboxylesterase
MPFFDADSITFHYLDVGQGLPFVFQHGLGGDVQQTQGVFEAPLPFRLLTLDCRGHGQTRPLGDPARLSFNQFADDILALVDALSFPPLVVGGISMGAGVALNFAIRYPQWVKALVLVRPAWLHEPLPANLQVYPRIAEHIRRAGVVQGEDQFTQTDEYRAIQHTFPVGAASLAKQFVRPQAEEFVDILERLPRDAPTRSEEEWTHIDVPTLILANEHDPIHPFHYGEVLARAIPGATLTPITSKEIDADQHTQDVRQAIERFLRALP